jgi:hypothetical protein
LPLELVQAKLGAAQVAYQLKIRRLFSNFDHLFSPPLPLLSFFAHLIPNIGLVGTFQCRDPDNLMLAVQILAAASH